MATRKTSASSETSSVTGTRKKVQVAIAAAEETLALQEETKARPETEAANRRQQEAVQAAAALAENAAGIQEIAQLKISIGKMLGELSEKLEAELQKFQTVQRAVMAKEQELKDFYEIERHANTLAALVEAQASEAAAFGAEMAERKAAAETEMAETRERWQKEKAEYELAVKAQKEADRKQREREREEYEYAFNREQTLARNKFEDEKVELAKELEAKRETADKELAEREKVIIQREVEYKDLRVAVERLTKERDTAVKQAVEALREKLTGEHKAQVELMQKGFEGERSVLNTRIDGLERTAKEQAAQLTKSTSQLEAAYAKVQDIAVRALEGSANAKTVQGLQNLLAESVRGSKSAGEK